MLTHDAITQAGSVLLTRLRSRSDEIDALLGRLVSRADMDRKDTLRGSSSVYPPLMLSAPEADLVGLLIGIYTALETETEDEQG